MFNVLFKIILVAIFLPNVYCASYRGTNQLEAKLDALQTELRDVANKIDNSKHDEILQPVQRMDDTLQKFHRQFEQLGKQSEVWATHEHFITSWLDQISAVDRKLDIIIKSQERLNKVEIQLNAMQEQLNKIDLDKFEHLVNRAENTQKVTKHVTRSNNDLFSFIDEYTTRGVLSTLNRIENQIIVSNSKQSALNCSASNDTMEILEDIASKVDIIVDKMSVPEPTIVQPEEEPPETGTDSSKSAECLKNLYGSHTLLLQERYDYTDDVIIQYLNKSWVEYEAQFKTETAFWLGLANVHEASTDCVVKLRIELWDFDGNFAWAEYDKFQVSGADSNYTLTIDGYRGNATDSLGSHNGSPFSTYDRNNDNAPECCPCSVTYGSGWWFNKCFESNLNGRYSSDPYDINYYDGIIWEGWLGNYSLKKTRMLLVDRQWGEM